MTAYTPARPSAYTLDGSGHPPAARDSYAAVGAATRDALTRAAQHDPPLRPRTWRVLAAVVALTATYSRCTDRLTHDAIGAACGLDRDTDRRNLSRELRWLADAGLITYRPGSSDAGGRRTASVVGIPRPPVGADHLSPVDNDATPGRSRPPVGRTTDGRTRHRPPVGPDHLPEKYPEKTPPAHARTREAAPPSPTGQGEGGATSTDPTPTETGPAPRPAEHRQPPLTAAVRDPDAGALVDAIGGRLDAGDRARMRRTSRMLAAAERAVRRGWPVAAAARAVADRGHLADAASVDAVLAARLDQLGDPPPDPRTRTLDAARRLGSNLAGVIDLADLAEHPDLRDDPDALDAARTAYLAGVAVPA